jgi:circadian clock protein KaiB
MVKENGMVCVYENGLSYVLRLYVTGITSRSQDAIRKVKEICEQDLRGFYELEVIYEQPDLTKQGQNLALPTLVRRLPSPLKKLITDLSNRDRVIVGLEIVPMEWSPRKATSAISS